MELRPSESDIARDIVVAIIPSADVTSPKLELKDKEYDNWGDKVMDKLQDKFQRQSSPVPGRSAGSGRIDPAPVPFRGSTIKIEEAGMGCSFRLVRIMPLVTLARGWGEYQTVRKNRIKNGGAKGKEGEEEEETIEKADSEARASAIGDDDTDVEEGKPIGLETSDDDVQKLESSWLRFVTFYIPVPHIRVRVSGVNVEVDKAYLAPEPPEDFLPRHQHQRTISFFGEDNFKAVFDEGGTTDAPGAMPAAIVPTATFNAASGDISTVTEALPRFANQGTMLQGFDKEAANEANSIIFHMERWVEHTKKNSKKEEKRKSLLQPKDEQGQVGNNEDVARRMSEEAKPKGKDETSKDRNDDMMNLLLQLVLRRVLSSIEVDCTNISLTIAGGDGQTVQNSRKEHAVEPFRANVALSKMGWHQRALTFLSVQKVFVSFEGPDCHLNASVSGILMQVGLPANRKASVGSKSSTTSPGRKTNANDIEKSRRRTWYTVMPSNNDIKVEASGVLSVLVWALNYDHRWEKRKLGIDLTISNMSLCVEPLPLFSALVHLDDFTDPNSSHGEWAAWLRKKHQLSISPLSDDERVAYCNCYGKVHGIKWGPSEEKSARAKLKEEKKPSYLQFQDKAESFGVSAQTEAQSPSVPKQDTDKKDGESDRVVLDALEARMTCDEILKERCSGK